MSKLRLIRVEPKYASAKHQYCWVEDDDLCVVGHEFTYDFPNTPGVVTWVIKEKIDIVIADYLYPYVIESEDLEEYTKADVTEHD